MILGGAISSEGLLVRLFLLILPATSRPSLGRSSINRPAVAEVGFSRILHGRARERWLLPTPAQGIWTPKLTYQRPENGEQVRLRTG